MANIGEYVQYLDNHINEVKKAWEKMKNLPDFPYSSDLTFKSLMDVMVDNHDNSKFSQEELEPYAAKFFPDEGEVYNEEEFQKAWAHHVKMNPHHPQFWVTEDGIKVVHPYLRHLYLCEMVCDWMAMGVTAGNTASSWYKLNRERIILDDESRVFTELLLRVVEPEEWS